MYKYLIAKSPRGYEVYVNLIKSSAGQYLSRQPYILDLIKEVIAPMNLTNSHLLIEYDMGRVIGNTDIVETTEKDTIFYAQPYKTDVFSRYVKNRSLSPCPKLTIVLRKDEEANYEIYDTWIGPSKPPFPGDAKETAKSKKFWETHALVADSHKIQSKSITKICPYQ